MLVAAGGGGDAIAATMLSQWDSAAPVIATWAWDRLAVDPLPGPRGTDDFDGLRHPAHDVNLISPTTTPRPPGGSPLPRLAGALDAGLALLDPNAGCRGLVRQLRATAKWCGADRLTVVDVGGDALARPGDPGLRSPLADISTLDAAVETGLPTELIIVGVGCDGELQPALIHERLDELGARGPTPIRQDGARRVVPVLEWHPSEATALVVMATLGYRGIVEIRDKGLPVALTDQASSTWDLLGARCVPASALARAIASTESLRELEDVFRDAYGVDELEYERHKAAEIASGDRRPAHNTASFLAEAASRGVDWVTRRRLREATGHVPESYARALLVPTGRQR